MLRVLLQEAIELCGKSDSGFLLLVLSQVSNWHLMQQPMDIPL